MISIHLLHSQSWAGAKVLSGLFCNALEKILKNFIKQYTLGANKMFLKALPHIFLINPWMMMISPNYDAVREIWQWPQDWKRSVFIPIPKKGNAKDCTNYRTIVLLSHASKIMLKFSKPGFNSMWTENFQKFKLDWEKAEEPEIKLPTSIGS